MLSAADSEVCRKQSGKCHGISRYLESSHPVLTFSSSRTWIWPRVKWTLSWCMAVVLARWPFWCQLLVVRIEWELNPGEIQLLFCYLTVVVSSLPLRCRCNRGHILHPWPPNVPLASHDLDVCYWLCLLVSSRGKCLQRPWTLGISRNASKVTSLNFGQKSRSLGQTNHEGLLTATSECQ